MIFVNQLSKSFRVPEKKAGWKASLGALFRPKTIEKFALDQVDLTVAKGEILGLLGANGAGKTTLVKCLSGIIAPTSGQVRVLGEDPWKRSVRLRKQLSLVMGQKAQLWWDLPAEDSFFLLKEIYQVPEDDFHEDLNYLLEVLGAQRDLRVPLRRLSLGERMKMELIGALLHRPKVIYLDEPTIGLDFTAQKAIRRFILEYRNRYKPAVILTSHYMEDIESLCERIVILNQGKKVYDGPLSGVKTAFNEFKMIHVQLADESESQLTKLHQILLKHQSYIKTQSIKGSEIQLEVKTSDLPLILPQLFSEVAIHDFSLSGTPISDQIEKLMLKPVKESQP